MRIACVLFAGLVGAVQAEPVKLIDFDKVEPADGWTIRSLTLEERTLQKGATPTGGRALRLVAARRVKGILGSVARASPVRDWRKFAAVGFWAHVEAQRPVSMRLLAIRGNGPAALLHRFSLQPGGWRKVTLRLADFREDIRDQVCGFGRIDRFMIRWDAGPGTVTLDDLELEPGRRGKESCLPSVEEELRLAFPEGGAFTRSSDHFFLLSDVAGVQGRNGGKLLDRCEKGLGILRKTFGVNGAWQGGKAFVVVLGGGARLNDYLARLGKRYRLGVPDNPNSSGIAILGRSVTTYKPRYGWDRPLTIRYALYAALHRILGVGCRPNWINAGLAGAVQLRLYPETLVNTSLAKLFAKRARGEAPFLDWPELFHEPGVRNALQCATIFEYLQDRYHDRLPQIMAAIRSQTRPFHEETIDAIAEALDATAEDLEREWLAWGRAHYRK